PRAAGGAAAGPPGHRGRDVRDRDRSGALGTSCTPVGHTPPMPPQTRRTNAGATASRAKRKKKPPNPADVKPNGKRKSIFWRWRRAFFLLGLLLVAAIAGVGYIVANVELPPERIQAQTSFICGADVTANCTADQAIAGLHGEQDRQNVTLDQVPQVMIDAVL